MKKRIFRSVLSVTFAVLVLSLAVTIGVSYRYFQQLLLEDLQYDTAYIAHVLEREGVEYLRSGLPEDIRVTWIDDSGEVLYDNREDAAAMENHGDREEVRLALQNGAGTSIRYSSTLDNRTLYYAVRLSDGSVLRTSDAQDSVWLLVREALAPVAVCMLLLFCGSFWLAGWVSRQLVAPINAIDLSDPGDEDSYAELAPLLARIRSQNRQIQQQIEDLRQRQKEFAAITEHMSEGLLVIDAQARVLSHNAAALALLCAEAPAREGFHVLELSREKGFRHCVEAALQGERCEEVLEWDGGCRSILASPVEQGGVLTGAVLVIMDVTEKAQREQLRREFTANVSHELKTPLTSIVGTAEIIKNGLVRSEDLPHFADNIYREARRLIGLVNDIIKLSRLDEGELTEEWTTVDLYRLAENVLEQLAVPARTRSVTLQLQGEGAMAFVVPSIAGEILYNLCDNAVAYNRPGGRVTVTVEETTDGPRVSVTDTGIGIPPEARGRIFERFYRVDKSHSGGGTGLGLSIVKHGAAYLQARLDLESEPGVGSTFSVTFRRPEL